MAIQKINVAELLRFSAEYPVLDVRSPGEYTHAHIPGAYGFPLFSDEERKVIGTTYKQQSREKAIKIGLDYFGVKMRPMVEEAEKILKSHQPKTEPGTFIVHCWRGGMRSAAVAWLLNFYGFHIYLLEGGYKAYRNWVLKQFEKEYNLGIVGGYTGSGKTEIMHALREKGQNIIDLEGLASHKGSAFGAIGLPSQPTQEMFENLLAQALNENAGRYFWLEDESQRIGSLNIPHPFWATMRSKPVFFVEINFEKRLDHIIEGYGNGDREKLVNAILRIQKRLGPLETKTAIGFLVEENVRECFRILLSYYDKTYLKALQNRENLPSQLNKIDCSGVDAVSNSEKIIQCTVVNT